MTTDILRWLDIIILTDGQSNGEHISQYSKVESWILLQLSITKAMKKTGMEQMHMMHVKYS
jgi:hypothetical protein